MIQKKSEARCVSDEGADDSIVLKWTKDSKKEQAMQSAPWILDDVQIEFGRNRRSLFQFLAGEGVGAVTTKDEDLALMEEFRTLNFVLYPLWNKGLFLQTNGLNGLTDRCTDRFAPAA